jgi:Uma2 family endonuclease
MTKVSSSPIRFSVAEYERMSAAGIFDMFGNGRTELVRGRVIRMAPQKHPHMWAISRMNRLLVGATTPRDWVIVQGTLYLDDDSAPGPDFHVFDVPEGTPADRLPKPILVIEVSHRTYRRDTGSKLRMYARAGMEDYWVVNLKDRRVEVYRDPTNPTGSEAGWHYGSVTHLVPGQSISMLKRPSVSFPVTAIIP